MRASTVMIALAICEIGSLAERRVAMLVDPALSGLPAFLTPKPGLNSGFMRAMAHNVMAGGVREGGSTITQQLAKNAFLDSDRTAGRKLREALIAFWLEAWMRLNTCPAIPVRCARPLRTRSSGERPGP